MPDSTADAREAGKCCRGGDSDRRHDTCGTQTPREAKPLPESRRCRPRLCDTNKSLIQKKNPVFAGGLREFGSADFGSL
ncbi:MAG: hypothetical protein BJ554DRAFT_2333 [Olpidium bornovanus]|uniref:Uncharacterized protein n=1 Tax=Olpidium bornovanus TaxID=278681 RepID=A0A8H8A0P3_9FUNG|nr:MAG: hypothetical protein BJ554DRAFT_2333 [Olpidium bornovanus]